MKDLLLMYAKYTQRANASVITLLDGLSEEARNENRKSYYKTLSGLAGHTFGACAFFHGLLRKALPQISSALKATEGLRVPRGDIFSSDQWSELKKAVTLIDQTTVDFVAALTESDLNLPIKIEWFKGNPDAVPLHYLLSTIVIHATHHRGQMSQILDEMGIEHNFSSLDVGFLPK
ncbi:MAG: DinB family protein [Thermodesulfobacteriota bacterium]